MARPLARSQLWNLPNTITVVRVAIIPVVMVLMLYGDRWTSLAAATLFILAALSDVLDGYLARRMGLVSTFGAFLDPLADKLLVSTAMVMLIPLDRIPAWMVALFLMREMTVTALRSIAASEGLIISASPLGKKKTAYQLTALSFLIIHHPLMGFDVHSVGMVLLWFALFYTMLSGWDYLRSFFKEVIVPG